MVKKKLRLSSLFSNLVLQKYNMEQYKTEGLFYNIENLQLRQFLDIKKNDTKLIQNDFTVIMMNPGSSKPKDYDEIKNFEHLGKFVATSQDNTQSQIIKIMDACKFEYSRIINLSDIRNTKSKNFYDQLKNELATINHSIFSEANKQILIENYNT